MGEEVNQDLDADGSGRRALRGDGLSVCVCVCVAGEHGHYADFPFSFKTLEEYFLFSSRRAGFCHLCCPIFMLRQGWSEGQKSGNQVNYGRWLADKSEREGSFFFLITRLNGAGSLQAASLA